MQFKFLEHTADIKFQAYGKTLNEMIENSVLALKESMFEITGNEKEIPIKEKIVIVKAKSLLEVYHDFLDEILFECETNYCAVLNAKIIELHQRKEADDFSIKAKINYSKNLKNIRKTKEVKAVTYHEMNIEKKADLFVGQVILDI